MTTLELRTAILDQLTPILDDEPLMEKVLNYVKRLAKAKQDPTLLTKDELLAKIEQGEEEYQQGKAYAMRPGESYQDFRKRIGV